MAFCHRCGKEAAEENRFCSQCGEPLYAAPGPSGEIPDRELSAFIGRNATKYLEKFRKFRLGANEVFAPTWHWPAFLFGMLWMLYRKLYLWALVVFLLYLVPGVNVAVWIGCGIVGNYLYYRHVQRKILEIRHSSPGRDTTALLAEAGGVNRWVVVVGVVLALLLAGLALLASLLVPRALRDVITV